MKKHREEIWITTGELAQLEGVSRCAIAVRIRSNRYKRAKKVRSRGGGTRGNAWLVSIHDKGISSRIREKYLLKTDIKYFLKIEIKAIYEKLRKRRFMEMTVREFFEKLSEDMFL